MRSIVLNTVAAFAFVGMAVTTVTANTDTVEEEPEFGVLTVADGVETTYYTCTACHSERIIAQQGLTYDRWDELIDWMVEEQGLGEPDKEDREEILVYLSTNYGAAAGAHRGPVGNPDVKIEDREESEYGVLVVAEGVDTVFYTCSACHSERIIAQQGQTRRGWEDLIEWMVDEQGLGQPDDEDMKVILDYLEAYYNEDRANYPSN